MHSKNLKKVKQNRTALHILYAKLGMLCAYNMFIADYKLIVKYIYICSRVSLYLYILCRYKIYNFITIP